MKKVLIIVLFSLPLFGMHDEREHVERILNPLAGVSAIAVEAAPSDSITPNQNYKMAIDFLLNPADRVPAATSSHHLFSYPHPGYTYEPKRHSKLKGRLRTHPNAKPFKCTQCDYATKLKRNLISHLRTHSDEKPFTCTQCDFATKWRKALIRHMCTHTNDKPFKCNRCNFATKLQTCLINHLRTHSKVKPFRCTQCNYATKWQTTLAQHMYTHSDAEPFKCDQCDFVTKSPLYLTKHMRRKHTTPPSPNQSEMEIAS